MVRKVFSNGDLVLYVCGDGYVASKSWIYLSPILGKLVGNKYVPDNYKGYPPYYTESAPGTGEEEDREPEEKGDK